MLVSLIIPVYNCEKYLYKCIKSVINQTYKDLEIILIDDGSTDRSKQIESDFSHTDKRIHTIFQNNHGVSNARNTGLINSNGEFIFFLDADDALEKNCIERLVKTGIKECSDIVVSKREDLKEAKKRIIYSHKIKNYNSLTAEKLFLNFRKISGYVTGKLYRNSILKNLYFKENMSYGEDGLYFFKSLNRSQKISTVSDAIYFYRRRNNSLTQRGANYNERDLDMFTQVDNIQQNVSLMSKKYFIVFKFMMYLSELDIYIKSDRNSKKKFFLQYDEMIKFCKKNWIKVFFITLNPRIKFNVLKFKLRRSKYEISKCHNPHI